jgi:hypothetical protein
MKTYFESVSLKLSPSHLRIGLAILSLVTLVLGGAADEQWTR